MGDESGAQVQGQGTATVAVFPENYFDFEKLHLANSGSVVSIDELGAKKVNKQATAPLQYVTALQKDLVTLGYLKDKQVSGVYGPETKRAVTRFQRHAARVYRMPGGADVSAAEVFAGEANGVCDVATADEIGLWLEKGFVNPVGRFKLRKLEVAGAKPHNRLRDDAATEWEAIVELVADAGGILTAEANGYGDTTRTLSKKVAEDKKGASSFSFHFSGRAIDIDQGWVGKGRYFIQKEVVGGRTFWRIFCKTKLQDGTQGKAIAKAEFKCFAFDKEAEFDIRAGHYLDLTETIESRGTFERIPAQRGFDDKKNSKATRYNKTEWWHFQYAVDKQPTFLDELELAGFTEDQARQGGWKTDDELDHAPG